jgi:hypothetical protein
LYRSLASSGASSSGGDGDEVHRATQGSWQVSDGMLDGVPPHLGGLPTAPASSRSGTQGVCPRPMIFLGLYDPVSRGGWLLQLLPKPVGDDHGPDLRRPPMRRWIPMSNDADPMNLLAISFLHTDLCAVWVEQLPLFLLYPSRLYAYLYEVLYAFVMY